MSKQDGKRPSFRASLTVDGGLWNRAERIVETDPRYTSVSQIIRFALSEWLTGYKPVETEEEQG